MKDWQNAQGTLFVRLDYADVAAWREWLPLPEQIASGTGALRIWFEFARQEPREIVADVELADVKATLAPELPEIELAHLSGRVGTRKIRHAAGGLHRRRWPSRRWTASGSTRPNFTLTLARRAGRSHGLRADRIRPAAARAARRVERAPAAAGPDPGRPRALCAARDADARAPALGRRRRSADELSMRPREFTNLGLVAQDAFPGPPGSPAGSRPRTTAARSGLTSNNATLDLPRVLAGADRVRLRCRAS